MDASSLAEAAAGAEVVIHAAAIVGVHNVLGAPRRTIEINFEGTANLLRAVKDNPNLHRFVFFSTSEVFGGASFRVDETHNASVGTVQEARWSYSIAKLAGEHLCYAYHREFGLPLAIIRPFNVYGECRNGDHAMLRFIVAALRDEPLEVHGDGSQVRAWCHAQDFTDALVQMIENDAAIGQDYNIGNGQATHTIYDLAKRIILRSGSSSELVFKYIDYSDIDIRVPQTVKARKELGWTPKIEMDEGIDRTVAWYREHLSDFDWIK